MTNDEKCLPEAGQSQEGMEQPPDRPAGVRLHKALDTMLKCVVFVFESNGELLVILSRGKTWSESPSERAFRLQRGLPQREWH